MRIIGGKYRSRRITPPPKLPVRPTTDMAREALFNLLMTRADIEESIVTDLFSGTGFIAYEFCSRGADAVTAVEKDRGCIAFIRKTAELLQIENLHVVPGDVFRFLQQQPAPADIVFADPPYEMDNIETLPDTILDSGALKPDGIMILEHGKTNSFTRHPNFSEERKYGSVHFSFFNGTATTRSATQER